MDLSLEEAAAYLDQFLREQPERLARLAELSESTGGPSADELDYIRDSLLPLWRWARERLSWNDAYEPPAVIGDPPAHIPVREDLPPAGEIPSWGGAHPRDFARFSPETLWLIDMVTRYFAEALQKANPNARWSVGHSRISGYIDENQPVLTWGGDDLNPLRIVMVITDGALSGVERHAGDDALPNAFDRWIGHVQHGDDEEDDGKTLDGLDFFDVEEYDPEGEWTYDIYLDDWFAAVGEDHVDRLISDLSADPRVVEVHHEDREHILVNAPDLTLDTLRDLVQTWFDHHAAEIRETIELD